jgi:hypothetical protein
MQTNQQSAVVAIFEVTSSTKRERGTKAGGSVSFYGKERVVAVGLLHV